MVNSAFPGNISYKNFHPCLDQSILVKSFLRWERDSEGLLGLGVYTGVST